MIEMAKVLTVCQMGCNVGCADLKGSLTTPICGSPVLSIPSSAYYAKTLPYLIKLAKIKKIPGKS